MALRACVVLLLALWLSRALAPGSGSDLSASVSALTGTSLVLLMGWVVAVALLAHLARLPGPMGRAAAALVRVLLPPAARLLVAGVIGVQLAAPAAAADVPSLAVERPVTRAPAVVRPEPVRVPDRVPDRVPGRVVVAAGDSLWTIARRHLGPSASDADVAAAWPQWFAANREVIGDDPDLLRVGTMLSAPSRRSAPTGRAA